MVKVNVYRTKIRDTIRPINITGELGDDNTTPTASDTDLTNPIASTQSTVSLSNSGDYAFIMSYTKPAGTETNTWKEFTVKTSDNVIAFHDIIPNTNTDLQTSLSINKKIRIK